ncbi:hypothetical protein Dimus_032112, partial [Dionaea muscipula]
RENGVWWLRSGENSRRDDEEVAPAENEEVNEEEELCMRRLRFRGESGLAEKFYDTEDEVQEPGDVIVQDQTAPATFLASPTDSSTVQKEKTTAGVDPSIPPGSILDSVVLKLQAEFDQARARRLQADLDKAQAENARLLTLL